MKLFTASYHLLLPRNLAPILPRVKKLAIVLRPRHTFCLRQLPRQNVSYHVDQEAPVNHPVTSCLVAVESMWFLLTITELSELLSVSGCPRGLVNGHGHK
jgi:hypothetical protein